jgi:RNA polymerase sigma-70 factor (ECF subfamily)
MQVSRVLAERTHSVAEALPVARKADLELARRAAARDEAAWREIYEATHDRLFALLCYYTGSREEALELLQETYLSALRVIHRYRGDGSLVAWFVVIAIRRARDWRRRLLRSRRARERLEREAGEDPPGQADPDAKRRLQEALGRLKGKQRAAFLLRELEGMSFREIGRALGCGEGTARVHHFRARENLRRALDERTCD